MLWKIDLDHFGLPTLDNVYIVHKTASKFECIKSITFLKRPHSHYCIFFIVNKVTIGVSTTPGRGSIWECCHQCVENLTLRMCYCKISQFREGWNCNFVVMWSHHLWHSIYAFDCMCILYTEFQWMILNNITIYGNSNRIIAVSILF